ncbi:probable histone chaperone ASF1A [Cucurbita pepo subsp. pepo]|nr:probable histone chaperone ASF1A [Cucurbita pepo subsp. pepo]
MSAVNITNVTVLDNPAAFLNPFQFEISYECLTPLKDDLEWKLTYVGSAEDETYDQLLESVLVGPVNVGNYRFVLQADPPDPSKIREEDITGVTVLLLTCSYMGQEFIRVGYYVNNDYDDEQLREEPPPKVLVERIQRNILADKPRVTKFPINFHPENSEHGGEQNSSPPAEAINNEEEEEELQASPLPSPSPSPPPSAASDEPSLEQDAVDTEAQPSVTAN